jgi:hypothetical protein
MPLGLSLVQALPKVFSPEYLVVCQQILCHYHSRVKVVIRNVQETILILVFFINAAHQCSSRWQDFINEDEDGFLRAKLDALPDNIDELTNCQIGWN